MEKSKDFFEIRQGDTNFLPDKTPKKVNDAIKARGRKNKKLEGRTIEDVVADAINPRHGR